jgi:hypothetical protein
MASGKGWPTRFPAMKTGCLVVGEDRRTQDMSILLAISMVLGAASFGVLAALIGDSSYGTDRELNWSGMNDTIVGCKRERTLLDNGLRKA